MIYMLNDIKFGHPKLLKHQFEYFDNVFMPNYFLNYNEDWDEIIISGDLFYNTKQTSFDVISKVLKIIKELSDSKNPIQLIGNPYCDIFDTFNVHHMKNHGYKDDHWSLFHFNKEYDVEQVGYGVRDEKDKFIFIKNVHTPKFIEYTINTIEDLNTVKLTKDFIDLTINSELLNNQQNKNIIDLFLNNNNFSHVYYTEKIKDDVKVDMDSKNINIRNILINNVEEELKDELSEIFVIYDEKN